MLAEQERLLYRPEEAARVLAISRSKLYQMLARGELRSIRIGRAARIPATELRRWLTERLAEAEEPAPREGGAGGR